VLTKTSLSGKPQTPGARYSEQVVGKWEEWKFGEK